MFHSTIPLPGSSSSSPGKSKHFYYNTFIPVFATPILFHKHYTYHNSCKHEFPPSIFHPEELFCPDTNKSESSEERTNNFHREETSDKFKTFRSGMKRGGDYVVGYTPPWVIHCCDSSHEMKANSKQKESHTNKDIKVKDSTNKNAEPFVVPFDNVFPSTATESSPFKDKTLEANTGQLSGSTLQGSSQDVSDKVKYMNTPTLEKSGVFKAVTGLLFSKLQNQTTNIESKVEIEQKQEKVGDDQEDQEDPEITSLRQTIRNKNRQANLESKKKKKHKKKN